MQYTVPETTLRNAVAYLEADSKRLQMSKPRGELNRDGLHALRPVRNRSGRPRSPPAHSTMSANASTSDPALLAAGLANMEPSGAAAPRVRTLLDDIAGIVELTATGASWREASIDYRTLNTNTRSTSIVLAAFSRLKPDHPLLPQVVRWLMITREAGRWSTTQENAWAIIALTDWLAASGELEGDYAWETMLNSTSLAQGEVTPQDLGDPVQMRVAVADLLRDQANVLSFSRSSDLGQMYYTADLRYYLDATAVDSRDRGIVVDRSFTLLGGEPARPVSSAQVGDVVRVTVTIVAPTDLHHVLVEAPIPAGLGQSTRGWRRRALSSTCRLSPILVWRRVMPGGGLVGSHPTPICATTKSRSSPPLARRRLQYTFNASRRHPGRVQRTARLRRDDVLQRCLGPQFRRTIHRHRPARRGRGGRYNRTTPPRPRFSHPGLTHVVPALP